MNKHSVIEIITLSLLFVTLGGAALGVAVPSIAFWLGVVLALGTMVGDYIRKNQTPFGNLETPLHRTLLFWLAVLTLSSFGFSSITGLHPETSISKWATVVGIAFGGGVLFLGLLRLTPSAIRKLPMVALWSSVGVAAYACAYGLYWKFGIAANGGPAVPGKLQKVSTLLSIMLPFAYTGIFLKDRLAGWAAVFVCVCAVFLSGGRSGIVAYVIMVIVYAYFFPWGQVARWGRVLGRYALVNIAGGLVGTFLYLQMIGEETFVRRVASPRAATGSGRTGIWEFAWDKFLDHPVTGIGVQGFRYLDFTGVKLSSTFHPHNITIEILLETGLVGLILIISFVLLTLYKTAFTAHRKILTDFSGIRVYIFATTIALMSYFIAGQFLTSFFHGWWLAVPTSLMALLGALTVIFRRAEDDYVRTAAGQYYPVQVTVVMPCHNGETYLAEAIESVRRQSLADWELIVVNDGSADRSQEIINRYCAEDTRIRQIRHETARGAGAARNAALEAARGRYIAFLDCDDLWAPNKLERQIAAMHAGGAAFSTTRYDVIDGAGKIIGEVAPMDKVLTFGRLLKCNDIGCSVAVLDRALIGDVRFPAYPKAQDFVLWCRILAGGHLCLYLHDVLGSYRVHSKSRTLNKWETAKNRIHLLSEALHLPWIVIPYYIKLYILYGVLKQIRSGVRIIRTSPAGGMAESRTS